MSFSAYKRRVLLGWLREIEEEGRPMPGARAIATRLDFGSVSLGDDIVDDMVVESLIAIDVVDGVRRVRVLVPRGTQVGSSPSSMPPRLRQAHVAASQPQIEIPRGGSGTARKAPSAAGSPVAERTSGRPPYKKPAADAQPAPPTAPLPPPPRPAAASVEETPPPLEHRPAASPHSLPKPCVPAPIVAAAIERGQPVHEFVEALINIGFAEWKRAQHIGLNLA